MDTYIHSKAGRYTGITVYQGMYVSNTGLFLLTSCQTGTGQQKSAYIIIILFQYNIAT